MSFKLMNRNTLPSIRQRQTPGPRPAVVEWKAHVSDLGLLHVLLSATFTMLGVDAY